MKDTVLAQFRNLRFVSQRIVIPDKDVVFRHIGIRRLIHYCLLAALSTICTVTPQRVSAAADPYRLVDPRTGTANDGQTYPVVGMPFGMTGWTTPASPIPTSFATPAKRLR